MNKIKRYDKENRLTTSLGLFFGIYTFYKYEEETVYQLTITKSTDDMSFRITNENEEKVFQIARPGMLLYKEESGNKKKEYTFNPNKNTLRKRLEVEAEPGKSVVIDDYTNSEGVTKRDILFDFNQEILNQIKNGKSKN